MSRNKDMLPSSVWQPFMAHNCPHLTSGKVSCMRRRRTLVKSLQLVGDRMIGLRSLGSFGFFVLGKKVAWHSYQDWGTGARRVHTEFRNSRNLQEASL